MEKLKNRRGVTLVELIMVMAIMAILGVAVMTLTTSSLNMYTKGNDLIKKEEVAKLVIDFVDARLEKVTSVVVGGDGGINTGGGITSGKNVLKQGNAKIFGADEASEKAVYGGFSVHIVFKAERSSAAIQGYDMLTYTVYVYSDGTNYADGYSLQHYPTMINNPEITGAATSTKISYS